MSGQRVTGSVLPVSTPPLRGAGRTLQRTQALQTKPNWEHPTPTEAVQYNPSQPGNYCWNMRKNGAEFAQPAQAVQVETGAGTYSTLMCCTRGPSSRLTKGTKGVAQKRMVRCLELRKRAAAGARSHTIEDERAAATEATPYLLRGGTVFIRARSEGQPQHALVLLSLHALQNLSIQTLRKQSDVIRESGSIIIISSHQGNAKQDAQNRQFHQSSSSSHQSRFV